MRISLKLIVLLAVTACACAAATAAREPLSVNLTLTERAGETRASEPVTGGIPLVAGQLKDVSDLAILDPSDRPVPAQFKVLSRHWEDGSINWVLADFQADVPAGGKAAYRLVSGVRNPRPAECAVVKQGADAVTVSTGPLEVVIDTRRLSLFKSVKLDGREMIAAGAEAGFVVEGMDGVRYVSTRDLVGPLKVKVLEFGPLRASILVEGIVKAGDNAPGYEVADGKGGIARVAGRNGEKLGFTARYEFYAGKPYCRIFHTVRNLGKPWEQGEDEPTKGWTYYVMRAGEPGNFFAQAAELVVNLRVGDGARYVLGGDAPHGGRLARGENAALYQASSASWIWQVAENRAFDPGLVSNAKALKERGSDASYYEYDRDYYDILKQREGGPFMGYKVYAGKRGAEKEQLQGNRAPGWADLSGTEGGATVAVRHFWQMYPKALEVGGEGRMVVGLWPRRWQRGHLFEGRIHRTHETFWYFHEGDAVKAKSAELVKRFNAPCYVLCDPTWYIDECRLFGAAVVSGKVDFGTYDGWALTAVHPDYSKGKVNYASDSSFAVEREKYDEYGVWHFGDGSKGGGLWYFSQFQEFDQSYTLLLHMARTGDVEFMVTAEECASHLMGIPAHEGGYGHQWAESSHVWSRGLTLYYYLTGLYEAREAMDWLCDYHMKASQGEHHRKNNAWRFNGRNAAWAVRGLYNCYDLTGDRKYLEELSRGLAVARARQVRKPGTNMGRYGSSNSFQMGTVTAALGEYYFYTGDEEALDMMIGLVEYYRPRRSKGDWLSPELMDGFPYAYLFTGYERYKELAEAGGRYYLRGRFSKQPVYRTGTASPKSWTGVMRYFQAYLYMLAHPRTDGAPPTAVKDLTAAPFGKGKVLLTWTAPGDDGSGGGKAKRYQVKYAEVMIAEDAREAQGDSLSFWAATNAKSEPEPRKPGSRERFEISGLSPGRYYFALKTRDDADNLSEISNVAEVQLN